MSFRTTLMLFIVLALVVGGYLGYSEWKKRGIETAPRLMEVDPLAIQRIEVVQGDKKVMYQKSFLKIWEMQEPRYNVVDSRGIETATVLLSGLQAPELKNASANPAEYGLVPPQYRVTLTLGNNTIYTLAFGNTTPDGRVYYMQKEGDPKIYLIAAPLADPVLDLFRAPPVTPTPTPTRTETPWPAHIPTETVTPTWTPWPTLTPTPYREPTVTMTPTSTPAPRTPAPLVIGTNTPTPLGTPAPGSTPGR